LYNYPKLLKKQKYIVQIEALKWQTDGWRCGYFVLYCIWTAINAKPTTLEKIPTIKMPNRFEEVVWVFLKILRRNNKWTCPTQICSALARGDCLEAFKIINNLTDEGILYKPERYQQFWLRAIETIPKANVDFRLDFVKEQ